MKAIVPVESDLQSMQRKLVLIDSLGTFWVHEKLNCADVTEKRIK